MLFKADDLNLLCDLLFKILFIRFGYLRFECAGGALVDPRRQLVDRGARHVKHLLAAVALYRFARLDSQGTSRLSRQTTQFGGFRSREQHSLF